jgi:hypothetical protein
MTIKKTETSSEVMSNSNLNFKINHKYGYNNLEIVDKRHPDIQNLFNGFVIIIKHIQENAKKSLYACCLQN